MVGWGREGANLYMNDSERGKKREGDDGEWRTEEWTSKIKLTKVNR